MNTIVIKGGKLIDGNGGPVLQDSAVVLKDSKIVSVSTIDRLGSTPNATVIDVSGKTVLPGFIDMHIHGTTSEFNLEKRIKMPITLKILRAIKNFKLTLDAGVTTARDAGGADLGVKNAIAEGTILGPRLLIAISVLSISGGHDDFIYPSGIRVQLHELPGAPLGICDGPDEVRRVTRLILRAGADAIKLSATGGIMSPGTEPGTPEFTVDEIRSAVEEAHVKGKKVFVHAHGARGIKNALKAGVDFIEHGTLIDNEGIELMVKNGSYLTTTLSVLHALLKMSQNDPSIPRPVVQELIGRHEESVKRCLDAGVKIVMGTDAGAVPHGTNLDELRLMVKAGLSPMQAIVASTKVPAESLDMLDRIGTLEAGKIADLVVVDGDPLSDITCLSQADNVKLVFKEGIIVKNILQVSK